MPLEGLFVIGRWQTTAEGGSAPGYAGIVHLEDSSSRFVRSSQRSAHEYAPLPVPASLGRIVKMMRMSDFVINYGLGDLDWG